jgi:hypothetical protein
MSRPDGYIVHGLGSEPRSVRKSPAGASVSNWREAGRFGCRTSSVTVGPRGGTAWFSLELESTENNGVQVTGVLMRRDAGWRIVQATFPAVARLSLLLSRRIRPRTM